MTSLEEANILVRIGQMTNYSGADPLDGDGFENFEDLDTNEDSDEGRNDLRFDNDSDEDEDEELDNHDRENGAVDGEEGYDSEAILDDEEAEFTLEGEEEYQEGPVEYNDEPFETEVDPTIERLCTTPASSKRTSGKKSFSGGKAGSSGGNETASGLVSLNLTKMLHHDKKTLEKLKLAGKSAKHVILSSNKISFVDIVEEESVSAKKRLVRIKAYFDSNQEKLLPMNVAFLTDFDVSHNRLEKVPSSKAVSHLEFLHTLNLSQNKIRAVESDFLCALADYNTLANLDLSFNEIRTLPKEIGLLTNLRTLKLKSNQLVQLPAQICDLYHLSDSSTDFDVSKNQLITPKQVCAQKGGIRWIRAYFQIAYGGSASVEDTQYYHLIVNQCETLSAINSRGGGSGAGAAGSGSGGFGASGSGKSRTTKGGLSKAHKGSGKTVTAAATVGSDGGKSLQLMMFVVGSQSSGKSTMVHQLMNSFKNTSHATLDPNAMGGTGVGLGGSLLFHDSIDDPAAAGGVGIGAPRLMREVSSSTISSTQSFTSMISRSAASTATSHSSLHRDISGATVHSSPGVTTSKRNLHLQLPPSIDEDDSSMSTNKQYVEEGDIRVSHWHPKKKHLNKFLTAHKGNPQEGLTVANLTGSNSKQAKRAKEYQVFEQLNDVKFAVWELGGPTCCNAINELFFHNQALYLIAWNIALSQSNYDFDVHVQQWIDLIHGRAPGSLIVIVATHCDLIDTVEANTRIANLLLRLDANEDRRRSELDKELAECTTEEARELVRKQLSLPRVDRNIIRVTHLDRDIALIRFLACHLVRLATATADNRTPFGLINLEIPQHYLKVKKQLDYFMYDPDLNKQFCTVQELDDAIYAATAERKTPMSTTSGDGVANLGGINNLNASGSRPPIAPRKNRAEHLEKTRQALEHFHKVGEVLWFYKYGTNNSNNTAVSSNTESMMPSVADSAAASTAVDDSSSIVYFKPDWLSKLIHCVMDAKLAERVASREVFSVTASGKMDKKLKEIQLCAAKGVFQWQDIREHLKSLQYDTVLFESLRHLLEDTGIIRLMDHPGRSTSSGSSSGSSVNSIPTMGSGSLSPSKSNLHKSISTSTLSKQLDTAGVVRRNPSSYDSMQQLLNMTSVAALTKSPSSAKTSGSSGDLPAILQLKPANPNDQKRYLIPALVPKIQEDHLQYSGYVTLERFYTFSRSVPVWLVHQIFATIYNECRKQQRSQRDRMYHLDICSPSVMCWENGFKQQHESVMMTVHLQDNSYCELCSTPVEPPSYQPFTPFTPHRNNSTSFTNLASLGAVHTPSSGGKPSAIPSSASFEAISFPGKDEGYCSFLVIQGLGHMLSSQIILKYLDYYCSTIHELLQQYPGFGGVQWVSTCPQCLLHDESDENKGTFSQQEIMQIRQENNPIRVNGVFDSSQLRYLNTKRYTCKKQRCQVKSEMLVQVPEEVKKAIEDTSKSEHEIHFLLDEVIRTSSRASKEIERSVVKIMAANGIAKDVHAVKSIGGSSSASGSDAASTSGPVISMLTVYPCSVSSGVVVNIPEENGDIHQKYQKILILSCEHLITEGTEVDKKLKYEKKFNAHNADTIFFIGDQVQWLYVAEMIYKGSTHSDSESNWWDICVLRIIAPVKPVPTVLESKYLRMELLQQQAGNTRSGVLQHPSFPVSDPPLVAVRVSDKRVVVDQVVRLLGYPENGELSIDWGRIVLNNESSDIMVRLLSDTGSSGGPIVDRNGELVGLLSKSHENYKNSCVQPIRNLFELIN